MSIEEHGIYYPKSQGFIDLAYRFAKKAHGHQKRRYTGEPYINHPVAVAKLVMTAEYYDCDMLCAAMLHDTIEDTFITWDDIAASGLAYPVADLVIELSDVSKPEDGNRAARKAMDREYLSKVSDMAKTIKLADLIDNSLDIMKWDSSFTKVYMKEKALLLDVLVGGDEGLMKKATAIVDEYFN